jgi:hypothetical protein
MIESIRHRGASKTVQVVNEGAPNIIVVELGLFVVIIDG